MFGHEEPEDFLTESVLRASIGAILGACVGCCIVLSILVFRQRKCKVSRTIVPSVNRVLAHINLIPTHAPLSRFLSSLHLIEFHRPSRR